MSTRTWTIHSDAECIEWKRQVAEHYPLVASHRLLRLALRYGLRSAARDPRLLLDEAIEDAAEDAAGESVEVQP